MNAVLQILCITLQEWFQLTVRVYHVINLFFFVGSKRKAIFNFHSLGSYFAAHDTDGILPRPAPVANYSCVLLICDTFGVFWFLSLEYVICLLFQFSASPLAESCKVTEKNGPGLMHYLSSRKTVEFSFLPPLTIYVYSSVIIIQQEI